MELSRKSDALAYLYHVLILYEIGVTETILRGGLMRAFILSEFSLPSPLWV